MWTVDDTQLASELQHLRGPQTVEIYGQGQMYVCT